MEKRQNLRRPLRQPHSKNVVSPDNNHPDLLVWLRSHSDEDHQSLIEATLEDADYLKPQEAEEALGDDPRSTINGEEASQAWRLHLQSLDTAGPFFDHLKENLYDDSIYNTSPSLLTSREDKHCLMSAELNSSTATIFNSLELEDGEVELNTRQGVEQEMLHTVRLRLQKNGWLNCQQCEPYVSTRLSSLARLAKSRRKQEYTDTVTSIIRNCGRLRRDASKFEELATRIVIEHTKKPLLGAKRLCVKCLLPKNPRVECVCQANWKAVVLDNAFTVGFLSHYKASVDREKKVVSSLLTNSKSHKNEHRNVKDISRILDEAEQMQRAANAKDEHYRNLANWIDQVSIMRSLRGSERIDWVDEIEKGRLHPVNLVVNEATILRWIRFCLEQAFAVDVEMPVVKELQMLLVRMEVLVSKVNSIGEFHTAQEIMYNLQTCFTAADVLEMQNAIVTRNVLIRVYQELLRYINVSVLAGSCLLSGHERKGDRLASEKTLLPYVRSLEEDFANLQDIFDDMKTAYKDDKGGDLASLLRNCTFCGGEPTPEDMWICDDCGIVIYCSEVCMDHHNRIHYLLCGFKKSERGDIVENFKSLGVSDVMWSLECLPGGGRKKENKRRRKTEVKSMDSFNRVLSVKDCLRWKGFWRDYERLTGRSEEMIKVYTRVYTNKKKAAIQKEMLENMRKAFLEGDQIVNDEDVHEKEEGHDPEGDD